MTTGEQLAQALRVKRHAPGFVVSPAVLGPQATVAEYDALRVRRAAAAALPVTWIRVGLLSRRAPIFQAACVRTPLWSSKARLVRASKSGVQSEVVRVNKQWVCSAPCRAAPAGAG